MKLANAVHFIDIAWIIVEVKLTATGSPLLYWLNITTYIAARVA